MDTLLKKFKDKVVQIENSNACIVDVDSWKDVSEFIKNDEDLSRKISRITKADLKNGGDGAFYIFLKKIK